MQASILRSFDEYTRTRCSAAGRAAVARLMPNGAAGLLAPPPDVPAIAAIALVANAERRPVAAVLESYGKYFVRWAEPEYPRAFDARDARAFLSDVGHVHELLKRVSPGAAPDVSVEETADGGIVLVYGSPRGLCALVRGMIAGVAEHYGEPLAFRETACMAHGAPTCRFEVRSG
jgi:predicted hydrocarbon binding protein